MHQTTITLAAAQQFSQQHRQQQQQRQQDRLRAFQEFKTSFHDLMDAADWLHYVEATGLQMPTLLRFARYHAPAPERLFARPAGASYFEPMNARTGRWVEGDYQATRATPQLLAYLTQCNPGWEFRSAASWSSANACVTD
jgi:hypothetical protein